MVVGGGRWGDNKACQGVGMEFAGGL